MPADFFVRMAAAASESTRYAGIGAIVPQIAAGGRQLSPNWFQFGAIPRWYRTGYVGVPSEPVFAFNSGAMLRVDALKQVGGYDPRFWLDNSDAMIFSKLHEHGKRVYVAGDIQVEHEFSMKDMQRRMSPARYQNARSGGDGVLGSADESGGGVGANAAAAGANGEAVDARRFGGVATHYLAGTDAQALYLATETDRRVDACDRGSRESGASRSGREPRISACMAAYNGGAFVEAQLQSILTQLRPKTKS